MENTIWIPKQEEEARKALVESLKEKSKELDWGYKAWLQFKFEKGDFEDMEPVKRWGLKILAYGK